VAKTEVSQVQVKVEKVEDTTASPLQQEKDEAEGKGDPHLSMCTTKATPHSIMCNEVKHEDEAKAVPHVDESATDDASTDTEDAMPAPTQRTLYRGGMWTILGWLR
jgi:hypothetical protein